METRWPQLLLPITRVDQGRNFNQMPVLTCLAWGSLCNSRSREFRHRKILSGQVREVAQKGTASSPDQYSNIDTDPATAGLRATSLECSQGVYARVHFAIMAEASPIKWNTDHLSRFRDKDKCGRAREGSGSLKILLSVASKPFSPLDDMYPAQVLG